MESHHHEHNHQLTSLNKAFIIGITLNIAFVIVEFGVGFYYNSLGLLSDAGHNLGDVASLVLAMLAFRLQKVHPNSRYTYGYKKSTILVSLLNAVILLVAVGIIIAESVDKLFHPVSVDGSAIAWTAGVGVVINALTAWLFMKDKDKDLNVKGAYLHMAADALVSVGVVVSGIIITYTGWSIIDPIIGLGIAVIIIVSTWGLLHDSLRLSLDGVPVEIDAQKIQQLIMEQPGVETLYSRTRAHPFSVHLTADGSRVFAFLLFLSIVFVARPFAVCSSSLSVSWGSNRKAPPVIRFSIL